MNEIIKTNEEIISKMRQGEKLLWGEIGEALDYFDKNELWREDSENLTQWLTKLGIELGVSHTYLFRYMSAARYFPVFAKKLEEGAPSLKEFSRDHNWEILELYKRISMVASEKNLNELREKILNKTISRSEMRRLWSQYRPALEGKSLRGRGASKDPEGKIKARSNKVYEAFCLDMLRHENSRYIRELDSPFWKVVPGNPIQQFTSSNHIDGVLIESEGEFSETIKLHSLMFVNYKGKKHSWPRYLSTYKNILPFFDSIWIITSSQPTPTEFENTPEYIGIFWADQDGQLEVLRPPQPASFLRESDRRVETYKALLAKWARS